MINRLYGCCRRTPTLQLRKPTEPRPAAPTPPTTSQLMTRPCQYLRSWSSGFPASRLMKSFVLKLKQLRKYITRRSRCANQQYPPVSQPASWQNPKASPARKPGRPPAISKFRQPASQSASQPASQLGPRRSRFCWTVSLWTNEPGNVSGVLIYLHIPSQVLGRIAHGLCYIRS